LSSDLIVTGETVISLQSGRLVSKTFGASSKTYINVHKVNIEGTFGLINTLSVRKDSGFMSINVTPKPASHEDSEPAIFEVQQVSGMSHIIYPAAAAVLPARDYRTTIVSRSGTVSGNIVHGEDTKVTMESGNLSLIILPYAAINHKPSSLTTLTTSGSMSIELLKPWNPQGNSLTNLLSSHSLESGNLVLNYPKEWAGSVQSESSGGRLRIKGSNVTVDDERIHGQRRFLEAMKEGGDSELKLNISSGNVVAVFGS
jgi:hypothetical protein